MGVLYAKVAGNWVPINISGGDGSSGGGLTAPAEAGPRGDAATQARFGNVDEASKVVGYIADPGGDNLVISKNGGFFTLYEREAGGVGFTPHASFHYGDSAVYPWRLTTLPHGGACLTRWELGGQNDYSLLSLGSSTILNAPSGGSLNLRIGNGEKIICNTNTCTIYPPISCNAISCASINSNNYNISAGSGGLYGGGLDVGAGGISCGNIYAGSGTINGGALNVSNGSFNGYIWTNNWIQTHKASQGGEWTGWGVLAKSSNISTIGFHNGTYAAGIRSHTGAGEAMECINYIQSAFVPFGALRFDTLSTIAAKRDVRSLRPERERIVVHLDPAADRIGQPDVMALRPVAFRYKVPLTSVEGEVADGVLGAEQSRERLGLIAEEVQHVVPSAVTHDADGTVKGVDYSQVTVALLDHVQRLTDEVATLRYRVTELEGTQP